MTRPEDIDSALLAIPPNMAAPRPAMPAPTPIVAVDLADAIERARRAALESAPDGDEGKRARAPKARDLRFQVPEFVRTAKPEELLGRISFKQLTRAVSAWEWGAPGLLLLGHTKAGKTTAAAWLFRRLILEGWTNGGSDWELAQRMRWHAADTLMRARIEHPLGHGEAPEIVEACAASLLVIDDAGWDRKDPSVVSHVLNARYEHMRPTILTAGITLGDLGALYGQAVMRRIGEAGGKSARVVECFGS